MASTALTPDPGSVRPVSASLRPDPGSVRPVRAPRPQFAPQQQQALSAAESTIPDNTWRQDFGHIAPPLISNPGVEAAATPLIDFATRLGQATMRAKVVGQQRLAHHQQSPWNPIDLPADVAWVNTLVHSDIRSGQYAHDTSEITRQMMGATPEEYNALDPTRRQANELATQTIFDPLTIIGFSGFSRAAFNEATRATMPAIMRGAARAEERGLLHPAVRDAGGYIHGLFTAGGQPPAHVLRTLAAKYGPEGVDEWRQLSSMAMARDARAADIHASLSAAFHRTIHGLSSDEFRSVENAIHTGTIGELPENLQTVANRVRQIDRAIPFLGGSSVVRTRRLAGYQLPDELRRFDVGQDFGPVDQRPRAVINTGQVRENHVPIPHDEFAALHRDYEQGDITAEEYDRRVAAMQHDLRIYPGQKLTAKNVQFMPRGEGAHPEAAFRDAEGNLPNDYMHRRMQVWETSFRRAGRQMANGDLQRELSERYAPSRTVAIRAAAGKAPRGDTIRPSSRDWTAQASMRRGEPGAPGTASTVGGTRTTQRYSDVPRIFKHYFTEDPEQLGHLGKAARVMSRNPALLSDWMRGSLFMSPTQHPLRIASLLGFHAPERLPAAALNLIRAHGGLPTLGATPERLAQVFGDAERAGAVGLRGSASAGTGTFEHFLNWTRVGRPAAMWYRGVNNFIWRGADPAMKKALFDKYVAEGMDRRIAAHEVQKDMVNYERSSPAIRAAAVVSWFPTWRTLMPVAVARAIAKNPGMLSAAARVMPALIGGTQEGNSLTGGLPFKLGTSAPAEAAQIFSGNIPGWDYLRGSLNPAARVGLATTGLAPAGRPGRYWTNYQQPGQYLLGEMPGMNLSGYGYGQGLPQDERMRQQLLFELFGIEPQNQ